ncbi:hypothetical protein SUGI_0882770 [Cryptomeria japonica]|nr:hypothetical protein SUGI_0882770 [Cryptomeria japonica]
MALLYMGKALCNLKSYGDSKKCCELASTTFKKHSQTSPKKVGAAFTELAMSYEMTNDFGTAIYFFKMALGIYEVFPKYQHAEGSTAGRLGWLLLMTGGVKEAISYLESAVQKMKESFGVIILEWDTFTTIWVWHMRS